MSNKPRNHALRNALTVSLALNGFMALSGMVASAVNSLSGLSKVSDVIAAPTGYLVGWLIQPKTHSAGALIAAALEGLIFSVAFYTALIWAVLKLIAYLRSRPKSSGPT